MHPSFKPGWTIGLLFILAIFLVLGNQLVFKKLGDISYQSAPLPKYHSLPNPSTALEGQTVIRVGVVSRFAPNIIYRLYQPIMDYLNALSENHHELVLSESYQDAAWSLQQGEVQASFLGAWMCQQLAPDSGLIPVAMPVNEEGFSRFHVVLVTTEDSPVNSLDDLKGCKLAVPSDQSFSGNWLQDHGLFTAGLAVGDLDSIQHFKHHETVIWQVLRGNFDAGVVKESLAQKYQSRGLKTVAFSPSIPGPPLVICRKNQSAEVKEMVQLLLALDRNNDQDLALMQSWTAEFSYGFIPVGSKTFQEDFLSPETGKRTTP